MGETKFASVEDFENYLQNIFAGLECQIENSRVVSDKEIVMIVIKEGVKSLVRAVCQEEPVGQEAVQKVLSILQEKTTGAVDGMVICCSTFSAEAKALAEAKKIELLDQAKLDELSKLAGSTVKVAKPAPAPAINIEKPLTDADIAAELAKIAPQGKAPARPKPVKPGEQPVVKEQKPTIPLPGEKRTEEAVRELLKIAKQKKMEETKDQVKSIAKKISKEEMIKYGIIGLVVILVMALSVGFIKSCAASRFRAKEVAVRPVAPIITEEQLTRLGEARAVLFDLRANQYLTFYKKSNVLTSEEIVSLNAYVSPNVQTFDNDKKQAYDVLSPILDKLENKDIYFFHMAKIKQDQRLYKESNDFLDRLLSGFPETKLKSKLVPLRKKNDKNVKLKEQQIKQQQVK